MKLSIVIPVYNEEKTILTILKLLKTVKLPKKIKEVEYIIVDDYSTDKTREILKKIKDNDIKIFYHEQNTGKGGALQTGFQNATGDIIIIQDADLEYDPHEYPILLKPILENKADVVYGSRFAGGEEHRILYFWHTVMNKFLTLFSNAFSDLNLTDMETCYKVFKAEIIKSINIKEKRFGFEPEITAKIAKLVREGKVRMFEVGISYNGRTYEEGKKINWKDGIHALKCIYKYNDSAFAILVKYIINGILIATFQFFVAYLLLKLFNPIEVEKQSIINLVAIEASVIFAYFIHQSYTWNYDLKKYKGFFRTFLEFHVITGVSILVRATLFPILAVFGVGFLENTLIGILVSILINFLGYSKVVFVKKK